MSQSIRLPRLIAHADWSTHDSKRWIARAVLHDGRYLAHEPEKVGCTRTLLARLRDQAGDGGVFVGFDFPIGIPAAYAEVAKISDFVPWLRGLGRGEWANFYEVCRHQKEITHYRPFYPYCPGGTTRAHLTDALGVGPFENLRRVCDYSHVHAHGTRRAACPLFWTLGGQQVGKAAISGWREFLVPAISALDASVAIWPFDGALEELLGRNRVVIAETYPAEFYHHLEITFPIDPASRRSGKRVQASRRASAGVLESWAQRNGVELTAKLGCMLRDGFGDKASGEDPFDAVVGLFGMLNVVRGGRDEGAPCDSKTRRVEGWILGQDTDAAGTAANSTSAGPVSGAARTASGDQ